MNDAMSTELDVRGLNCPLPILRAKQRIVGMSAGELLRVRATDRHALIDFTAFCDKTNHELVNHQDNDGELELLLRVGGQSDADAPLNHG